MTQTLSRFELHHTVTESGLTVVDCLAALTPLSNQQIKQCLSKGAVWLQKGKQQQRLRRIKKPLDAGSKIHLYYDPHILAQVPSTPALIKDYQRYSVWDKPAGCLAQGSQWGDHCSLLRLAEQYFSPARKTFLVHRLDKEASGLMIIAHDKTAAAALSELFQHREMVKTYDVWVEGKPEPSQQTITLPLDNKTAISHLNCVTFNPELKRCQLSVQIDTGRKHQIRRHCAAIGHPVVGDKRYGQVQSAKNLQLRATGLRFYCPLLKIQQQFLLSAA